MYCDGNLIITVTKISLFQFKQKRHYELKQWILETI